MLTAKRAVQHVAGAEVLFCTFVTVSLLVRCALPVTAMGEEPALDHVDVFVNHAEAHYRIPSMVVADDGTILAFCNRRVGTVGDHAPEMHVVLRRSMDGGETWLPIQELGGRKGWIYAIGSAVVDETTKEIMVLYYQAPRTEAAKQRQKQESIATGTFIARSSNSGRTWKHDRLNISPNSLGKIAGCHGSAAGITLRFGPNKGRLLLPARFATRGFDGHSEWSEEGIRILQTHYFNCSIYSDDHGLTWKTSEPTQPGTGEGCLVERSDGTVYYSSRAYFFDGKRRSALSHDGGETFTDFAVEPILIEPNQGCSAAMIRVPQGLARSEDAILFSNPANFPARNTKWHPKMGRYKMTVRLSYDGGKTWPVARIVNQGPSGYSSLAIASDGRVLLLYEKGREAYNDTGLSLARLNLEWLTGRQGR